MIFAFRERFPGGTRSRHAALPAERFWRGSLPGVLCDGHEQGKTPGSAEAADKGTRGRLGERPQAVFMAKMPWITVRTRMATSRRMEKFSR